MNQTTEIKEGEIVTNLPANLGGNQSLAVNLARAEIDQQITTAHAFPRSIEKAVSRITTLATLDDQSAEECIYALPRGGKPIKGPSIRLAEIIVSQWGNCRVGARVVHIDRTEKYLEAEGVFHDLESNMATTARVRRKISDKNNRLYNDDMIVMTGNAACSIAKRNAIIGGVPKGIWRKAYEAAERVITGDIKTLATRRETAMKAFAAFGVTPEMIFNMLGVGGLADINLEHMVTLTGMHSALKSGEESVETLFAQQQGAQVPTGAAPPPPVKKPAAPKEKQPPAEAKAETAAASAPQKDAGDIPENLKRSQSQAEEQKQPEKVDPETGEVTAATQQEEEDPLQRLLDLLEKNRGSEDELMEFEASFEDDIKALSKDQKAEFNRAKTRAWNSLIG